MEANNQITKTGILKEATDEGKLTIAFATYGEEDKDRDIFHPGSLYATGKVAMEQFGHGRDLPIGVGEMTQAGKDAVWTGQLDLENEVARNHFRHIKAMGSDQEYSFRAFIEEYTRNADTGGFNFYKARVFEVSPVLVGAGNNTRTLSQKSAGPGQAEQAPEKAVNYAFVAQAIIG